MNKKQREASITCPECGHKATVSRKTVNAEDVSQLQYNENVAILKDIANKTGVPLAILFAEALEVATSLENAIPILEKKHNICRTCRNLRLPT